MSENCGILLRSACIGSFLVFKARHLVRPLANEARMQDFKKLQVWKKAHRLALDVYRQTGSFPASERFGLIDQIRRAALSIPANIVEGSARGTDRDTAKFLLIALASAAELQYHLFFAQDLGLLPRPQHAALEPRVIEIKRMLSGFIRRLIAEG